MKTLVLIMLFGIYAGASDFADRISYQQKEQVRHNPATFYSYLQSRNREQAREIVTINFAYLVRETPEAAFGGMFLPLVDRLFSSREKNALLIRSLGYLEDGGWNPQDPYKFNALQTWITGDVADRESSLCHYKGVQKFEPSEARNEIFAELMERVYVRKLDPEKARKQGPCSEDYVLKLKGMRATDKIEDYWWASDKISETEMTLTSFTEIPELKTCAFEKAQNEIARQLGTLDKIQPGGGSMFILDSEDMGCEVHVKFFNNTSQMKLVSKINKRGTKEILFEKDFIGASLIEVKNQLLRVLH